MSEMQEEILWLCDTAHVPVIWATQVLDNFVRDGAPTRAEATDAALHVFEPIPPPLDLTRWAVP